MALNERIVPILSLHQPQVLRLSRRTPLQGSGHQPHRFLDAPAEAELATLYRVQAPADARLACQAHLMGRPVSVRRVYPAFVDAEAAREPRSWLEETEPDLETVP
jgi:hypothetical protein